MSAKRHERTFARRAALQVLYQGDILGESTTTLIAEVRCLNEEGPLSDYACELLRMVEEHKDGIDEHLKATPENWSLGRMPVVDRSILRLATCEMMYIDDVPLSVSINEAVELAKDFGGEDDSPRFVNGVLGRIATLLEEEGTSKAATKPAVEALGEEEGVCE